ncbi:MAG: AsnC family transcriptional regulator [Flavobacteriaceae bacterium CG_4_8_14_3_um_filter_34_10]|nr:Lrp/AsnC family transcriptional regulator [Flavobacteriia bacterium]OIP52483.1 MAG: AsnC family transcriptional regulator [Flavobacteriaceae bacterium CG2_30_34_30]PIQ18283.1 MAG: AsnC family transcriptional regulator [Flavobacteriaceae bacterium CG18_big_fil_WC_8_21_14_2_50_34_36]PIV48841.1 MAG: AsnC family transcriptional regulator [Flavobacteriaceae bacterium CG02_land_8_20_14_3_00_34_13]PIX08994.1 MAG: AsnC family transcriptional regulator [Flavobacteriaceae bacterium CG_4_8_14_3_um_filt
MILDTIDKKLIQLVQQNSKQTNKELSLHLNLSITAVYERIKKLEKAGIIDRYVAVINKEKVNKAFLVFCQIKLIQHTKEYLTKFEKEVMALDEVMECYHISGEYDYLLKILVKDMPSFREFMVTKLTTLQHIGSTQSSFSINEVKCETVLKV